ncbi:DUF4386 family protein [Microbacterium sp. SS28]|uniref:DUF4386 family protein n=1 Tax=Microbacterium sp. SS28 TaxID=2919948 RepID=UPI001FAA0960|nr:DUF4386 family protein [Microbacterium sp. SS28]
MITEAPVEASPSISVDPQWRPLVLLGAGAAMFVLIMIPIQALVFILSPPPQTVLAYFDLFQRNPLLGVLDLDLLLTIDYLAMVPFYLALFAVIRRASVTSALLATVFGLFSVVLFLVSREATFSMWLLSGQHGSATTAAEQAALVASGQTLLTLYNGGTFGLSYLLGALSTLIFSVAMIRHRVFGLLPGTVGVITGLTMVVPANLGQTGLVIAMLSLIPTALWLALLSRAFLRTAKANTPGHGPGHP